MLAGSDLRLRPYGKLPPVGQQRQGLPVVVPVVVVGYQWWYHGLEEGWARLPRRSAGLGTPAFIKKAEISFHWLLSRCLA